MLHTLGYLLVVAAFVVWVGGARHVLFLRQKRLPSINHNGVSIFDVEFYRDGGSIEFRIARGGIARRIWLETPFHGEPRTLLIESKAVSKDSPEVQQLLCDLDAWWRGLPKKDRDRVLKTMKHKVPYYNPSAAISDAVDLRRVLEVRDYVSRTYTDVR